MAEFDELKIDAGFIETTEGWNEMTRQIAGVLNKLNTSISTARLTIDSGDKANDARIGIGINEPEKQLHIKGDGFIKLQDISAPKNAWGELNVTGKGTLRLWQHDDDNKGGGGIDILPNGNVGIGTDIPTHHLHVKGELKIENGWVRVTGNKGIHFENHGGGFYMRDAHWIRTYGGKHFYHDKGVMRTDGELRVAPEGKRFIVKQNGKVGIGTNDPQTKLHVMGEVFAVNLRASSNLKVGGIFSTTQKLIEFKTLTKIEAYHPTDIAQGNAVKIRESKYGPSLAAYRFFPTGKTVKDWIPAIVGFSTGETDINERDHKNFMSIRKVAYNDKGVKKWFIEANISSEVNKGAKWTVDIMYVRKTIAK